MLAVPGFVIDSGCVKAIFSLGGRALRPVNIWCVVGSVLN